MGPIRTSDIKVFRPICFLAKYLSKETGIPARLGPIHRCALFVKIKKNWNHRDVHSERMVVIIRKAMHHILDLTTLSFIYLNVYIKPGRFHTKSLMVGGRIREEVKMGGLY